MEKIKLGAVGATIEVPVGTDVDGTPWDFSGATVTVVAKSPVTHTEATWTASVVTLSDGSQGFRVITGTSAAVDERGVWWLTPRAVFPVDGTYAEGRTLEAAEPFGLLVT